MHRLSCQASVNHTHIDGKLRLLCHGLKSCRSPSRSARAPRAPTTNIKRNGLRHRLTTSTGGVQVLVQRRIKCAISLMTRGGLPLLPRYSSTLATREMSRFLPLIRGGSCVYKPGSRARVARAAPIWAVVYLCPSDDGGAHDREHPL